MQLTFFTVQVMKAESDSYKITSTSPWTYTRSGTPTRVMKQPQQTNEGTDRRSIAEGQDKNIIGGTENLLVCVK